MSSLQFKPACLTNPGNYLELNVTIIDKGLATQEFTKQYKINMNTNSGD